MSPPVSVVNQTDDREVSAFWPCADPAAQASWVAPVVSSTVGSSQEVDVLRFQETVSSLLQGSSAPVADVVEVPVMMGRSVQVRRPSA